MEQLLESATSLEALEDQHASLLVSLNKYVNCVEAYVGGLDPESEDYENLIRTKDEPKMIRFLYFKVLEKKSMRPGTERTQTLVVMANPRHSQKEAEM